MAGTVATPIAPFPRATKRSHPPAVTLWRAVTMFGLIVVLGVLGPGILCSAGGKVLPAGTAGRVETAPTLASGTAPPAAMVWGRRWDVTARPSLRPAVTTVVKAKPAAPKVPGRTKSVVAKVPTRAKPVATKPAAVPARTVKAAASLPVIEPNYLATTPEQAQLGVDAGRLVLAVGSFVAVPTLEGDITYGFGYWSYLPMGYEFVVEGHTYQVFNRVWLTVHGGVVSNTDLGGDLDLHTCTPTGSTLTWARRIS